MGSLVGRRNREDVWVLTSYAVRLHTRSSIVLLLIRVRKVLWRGGWWLWSKHWITDTNPHFHSHPDPHLNPHPNTHSFCNKHTNVYAYCHSHSDPDTDLHANPNHNPNSSGRFYQQPRWRPNTCRARRQDNWLSRQRYDRNRSPGND